MIYKLDNNGNVIWNKEYKYNFPIIYNSKLMLSKIDNSIILLANLNSDDWFMPENNRILIVKFDKSGEKIWSKIMKNNSVANSIISTLEYEF